MQKMINNLSLNSIDPPCTAGKFKLAVFSVPTKALALTCDSCQSTKFKGYIREFIYVGTGYLIHHFHALNHLELLAGDLE